MPSWGSITFSLIHVVSLTLLTDPPVRMSIPVVNIPFFAGSPLRWALGIVGLELMIAIVVLSAVRRLLDYVHWLRFHRVTYPAVALAAAHSWWGCRDKRPPGDALAGRRDAADGDRLDRGPSFRTGEAAGPDRPDLSLNKLWR
jgi:hypothetical protein